MLADDAMTVSQMHGELEERGYERTENTVCHLVNELRDAGLVDVERLEEPRGATTKYHRANTIVLSYAIPESSTEMIDEMAARIAPDVADVVSLLESEYAEELADIASGMAPCEHCKNQNPV